MYNILVVDDDKEIVKTIEIYLERKKYQIFKAFDGIEALEQIKQNDINLIILDIMMPNKDGIETLTEIRKDKNIPVILLSAKSEDIDKIHGLNLGADDYITKPFSVRELMARVKGALNTRKRHKKILKLAKGFRGAESKQFRIANQAVMRSMQNAYVGRKRRKRDFRRLWITRISAACKQNGMNYSTFMNGLKKAGIDLNRKMLSEIAISDPTAFTALVESAKAAL